MPIRCPIMQNECEARQWGTATHTCSVRTFLFLLKFAHNALVYVKWSMSLFKHRIHILEAHSCLPHSRVMYATASLTSRLGTDTVFVYCFPPYSASPKTEGPLMCFHNLVVPGMWSQPLWNGDRMRVWVTEWVLVLAQGSPTGVL